MKPDGKHLAVPVVRKATWFINHGPGTQMDGNHDGIPCEQQWCTRPGAR
jgi:hypothetical protein